MKKILAVLLLVVLSFSAGCTSGKEVQTLATGADTKGGPAKVIQEYAEGIANKDFKAAYDLLSAESAKNVTPDAMKKGFTYEISLKQVLNEQIKDKLALVAVCFLVNDTVTGKRYVLDYIPVVYEQDRWAIVTDLAEKEKYQQALDEMQLTQEKLMYQDKELSKFTKWMEEQNQIFAKPLKSEQAQ